VPDDLPGPGPGSGPVLLAVLSAAAAGVGVVLAPVGLLVALALAWPGSSASRSCSPLRLTDRTIPPTPPMTRPPTRRPARRSPRSAVESSPPESPSAASRNRGWPPQRVTGVGDHPGPLTTRAAVHIVPEDAGPDRRGPHPRGGVVERVPDIQPIAARRSDSVTWTPWRRAAARTVACGSEQRFPQLVTDPDPRVRRKVARSRWVSPLILRRLTSGQDSRHRRHRRAPGHRTAGQNPLLVAARAAPGLGQRPVVAGAADGAVGPAASDVFGQAAADAVADEPAFVPVGGRGALVRP